MLCPLLTVNVICPPSLNFIFGLCRSLRNLCPAMRYGVFASRLEWERCPGICTASGIAMRTVSPESNVSAPWYSPTFRSLKVGPAKQPPMLYMHSRKFVHAHDGSTDIIDIAAPVS